MLRGNWKFFGGRRRLILAAALIVLLAAFVGGATAAVLHSSSDSLLNSFSLASPPLIQLEESFNGSEKRNVYADLSETGYSCFVRGAVLVFWQDEAGNVYGEAPVAGRDYSISYGSGWTAHNGFWYYGEAVSGKTENLVDSCVQSGAAPEGYSLHVKIIFQAVQANPVSAAQELWGYVPGSA